LPTLIESSYGGMASLTGPKWPGKYRKGRAAKGGHQSQY